MSPLAAAVKAITEIKMTLLTQFSQDVHNSFLKKKKKRQPSILKINSEFYHHLN